MVAVQPWLERNNLADLAPILESQGIDRLEELQEFDARDLMELGLPEAWAKRVTKAMGRRVSGRPSIWVNGTLPIPGLAFEAPGPLRPKPAADDFQSALIARPSPRHTHTRHAHKRRNKVAPNAAAAADAAPQDVERGGFADKMVTQTQWLEPKMR